MRPFIVAEIGASHNGSLPRALMLVMLAAKAGADAIKLQTFNPEQMADPGVMIEEGPWKGREALDLYRQAHTPREWHVPIFEMARASGIEPFSSVFHPDDVDFLETLGCPRYKIASFELTDLALISYAAATGKPMILSTGMATFHEVRAGLNACTGNKHVTLLKCTSAYPAPESDANLHNMQKLGDMHLIGCSVSAGLSDHTKGIGVAVAASALGASMIEKHITISPNDAGLDAGFAIGHQEFTNMVVACRQAAEALGTGEFGPTASEAPSLALRRRPGGKRSAP